MAHFAELNGNNKVIRVVAISNDITYNGAETENEQLGIDFCKQLYGQDTIWKQCSINDNFRNAFPNPGWYYYTSIDKFMEPKQNSTDVVVEIPGQRSFWGRVAYPTDGNNYEWNEDNQTWDAITE